MRRSLNTSQHTTQLRYDEALGTIILPIPTTPPRSVNHGQGSWIRRRRDWGQQQRYPLQQSTGAIDYLHRLDYHRVDAEEEYEGQIVGEQMGHRWDADRGKGHVIQA